MWSRTAHRHSAQPLIFFALARYFQHRLQWPSSCTEHVELAGASKTTKPEDAAALFAHHTELARRRSSILAVERCRVGESEYVSLPSPKVYRCKSQPMINRLVRRYRVSKAVIVENKTAKFVSRERVHQPSANESAPYLRHTAIGGFSGPGRKMENRAIGDAVPGLVFCCLRYDSDIVFMTFVPRRCRL